MVITRSKALFEMGTDLFTSAPAHTGILPDVTEEQVPGDYAHY